MTPTLYGRWQTRLLLLGTIGIVVTLPFFLGWIPGTSASDPTFLSVLAWIALVGMAWDAGYDYLQKFRWDRDWSAAFQLLAGVWEALFLIVWKNGMRLPLPGVKELPIQLFLLHYTLVWLSVFIASQTLMRILFPHWRFRGGEWL